MVGFKPDCSSARAPNTTVLLYLLPNSHPFPQLITEHSGTQHCRNRNVCDRSQGKKSPCLITNNFVIISADIIFVIYHKHVSDRQLNIFTPPVRRNNVSNSVTIIPIGTKTP